MRSRGIWVQNVFSYLELLLITEISHERGQEGQKKINCTISPLCAFHHKHATRLCKVWLMRPNEEWANGEDYFTDYSPPNHSWRAAKRFISNSVSQADVKAWITSRGIMCDQTKWSSAHCIILRSCLLIFYSHTSHFKPLDTQTWEHLKNEIFFGLNLRLFEAYDFALRIVHDLLPDI